MCVERKREKRAGERYVGLVHENKASKECAKYHHMPEGQNNVFLSRSESTDGMSDPTFLGIASKFFPVATLMAELSGGFPSRETLCRQRGLSL